MNEMQTKIEKVICCKTSNIVRTLLTIKLPGKSEVRIRIIHRSIFCRFILDWTNVENGKIIDYRCNNEWM